MNFEILEVFIKTLLYSILIFSIMLLISKPLHAYVYKQRMRNKVLMREKQYQSRNNLFRHIRKIIMTLSIKGKYYGNRDINRIYLTLFYSVTVFLTIFSLILFVPRIGITKGILYTILFSSIPYLFLRIRLLSIRIETSYEAEKLINEFINQYKLNNFIMINTLDAVVRNLKKAPNTKILLAKTSYRMKECKGDNELREVLDDFVYGIHTDWSKLLVQNIYLDINDNIRVLAGLEDIQKQLKQARVMEEREKRLNIENITLVIGAPILYVLTIYIAIRYFDFSIRSWGDAQFNTSTGLNYFLYVIISYLFSVFIMTLGNKKKFDI